MSPRLEPFWQRRSVVASASAWQRASDAGCTGLRRRAGALSASLVPAAALLLGSGQPALASASGQGLFLDAISQLRGVDPSVRDVRGSIVPGAGSRTGCGAVPSGDLVVFYCPKDRAVYALPSAISATTRSYGEAGVRYLAAHEMAHGRQHAVTGFASEIVKTSVLDELQADCIAGTYLNRLYGYTVDSQEGRQLLEFAYSIGDKAFYSRDWHGNPRLRVGALARGLRKGNPASCLSSRSFNYATLLQSGSALLQELRRMQQR